MVVTCVSNLVKDNSLRDVGRLAYPKSNLGQLLSVNKETSVKDEGGLIHLFIDTLPINLVELLPLRCNYDGVGIL